MKHTYQDALAHFGIGGAHPGGLALTKKILNREKLSSSMKILDAGCGTGQTAAYLAKTFSASITALDLHPVMLQKAKRRFAQEALTIETVRGSIEKLPFPDHSFDIVLSESVTAFTNVPISLSEFYRVLKPGGKLLAIEMTTEADLTSDELVNIRKVYGISQVYSQREWLSFLKKAGFKKYNVLTAQSVATTLNSFPDNDKAPDYQPSPFINPNLQKVLQEHQELTMLYSQKLGYGVFQAIR